MKHSNAKFEGLPTPDAVILGVGFYSGENAHRALKYLLQEVAYNPGIESYRNEEGQICQKTLVDYLETGYPRKPRYQLRDGDYAINELGLCCGYFPENGKWIAFDNTTNQCWVEEFSTEEECLKYLSWE